jgi:hypothetical protein
MRFSLNHVDNFYFSEPNRLPVEPFGNLFDVHIETFSPNDNFTEVIPYEPAEIPHVNNISR